MQKENDVNIIKRNKINIFRVKLLKKKKETLEDVVTKGSIKFKINENGAYKIVRYQINYQLEPLKIYLKCDKYKLKYIGDSTFLLSSPILFIDEIIFFTIKNLSVGSEDLENNFKINLSSYEDNTCLKPKKTQEKEGFSLQIKSESQSVNDILSFLLTVIICKRFQFNIKIYCQVKLLDFDFFISRNIKEGFLNKQIYCPFEVNNYNFILYVATAQKRLNKLNIEKIYDENLIKMSEIKSIVFFNSIQIIFRVKLLKQEKNIIKIKAKIDNKIKEISIIFDTKSKCKNFGYKIIDNNIKNNDNLEYFSYIFNEITAHGIEKEEKQNLLIDDKFRKKPGFINLNRINNYQVMNLNEIDTHIDININDLCKFYNKISEEARLLPIYYLKYKDEKPNSDKQILIRKNYYIIEEMYKCLNLNDNNQDAKFYESNYFYEEINEFIKSFNYMNSILEIHDEEMDELLKKIQKYIEKNKDNMDSKNENLKLFSEKFKNFKKVKKLSDYMKKLGINLYNLEDDLNESNIINDDIKTELPTEKEKQSSKLIRSNNPIPINEHNNFQNLNNINNSSNIINNKSNYSKNNNIKIINDNNNKNHNLINDKISNSKNKNELIDIKSLQDSNINNYLNKKSKIPFENKNIHLENNFDDKEDKNYYNNKEKKEIKEKGKKEENQELIKYNKEESLNNSTNNDKNDILNINNKKKPDDIINDFLKVFTNSLLKQNSSRESFKNYKENVFLKQNQDIWKQNEKGKGVYTDRNNINNYNYFENYLNNQINIPTKIFSNHSKINSLEQIKKEIKNRNEYFKNMKKNVNDKNYEKIEPKIMITNFGRNAYLPDKASLDYRKHKFESMLDKDDKDESNNSKKIIQMVKNKTIKIFKPSEQKANFIEKNYDDFKNKKIKFNLSFEENDEYFNEFDEELIQKIIANIKEREEKEEDETYKIKIEAPLIPQNLRKENKIRNSDDYITKDLLIFSKNYMEKFLEFITKTDIIFEKILFCFIIDCSLYLGIKVKLFNLLIILSIIKILFIIDIKFSILLSADDMYKVVIKNYYDVINFEDLIEILYETIIIKRFRNNILKTLETSIDFLKNGDRSTLYFALFDCMDESFSYPNYWLKNILQDKTNYFFLLAEQSRLYKEKNEDTINQMIKSFKEKIQESSSSKIKILNINFSNFDIDSNVDNIFSEFFNFLKNINELSIPSKIKNEAGKKIKNKNNMKINEDIKNLSKKKIEYFEEILNDEFYKKYDKIYFFNGIRQKSKLNLPDLVFIKHNIEIPNYDIKNSPEIEQLVNSLKYSFQDKTLIESIFYPNKATHKQLSTKGTEIDIMALILYTLQPLQEPMIYLENKGGLVRDYSITIIIDNSKSCFCEFNEKHSFLTMINLFNIINSMAIPSFDLIVTANKGEQPNILLFDKPSATIYKNYYLFEKLLILLINPALTSDLSEAIKIVYELKRKKRNDRDSYLFILTDGLFHFNDKQKINEYSYLCENLGIKIFGIGMGIFPFRAKELFDSFTFIYSMNPENLLKALSKIFGKIIKTESEIELISDNQKIGDIEDIFNKIETNNKFYFEELRKELQNIEKGDDIFNIFGNNEKNIYDEIPFIEEGDNLEIYSKKILKTQKILMVMFWSFELNKKTESPYVSPKYINTPSNVNGKVCIQMAIAHFGIENVIVLDYESAINELLKKNDKGECLYYSVWIFCGPQYAIFPPINGVKNTSNPNLVEEFINVLIEFWSNGGALVFLADGEPLNFQVNLFLEKVEFSKKQKLNFRIHGDYLGNNYLIQDKEGKMDRVSIFNKSNHKINYKGKVIQRQSLSHNLGQIYEGYTISYAVDKNKKKIPFNEEKKIFPFKIFGINSEGGISILIYEADSFGRGDILIDCGYTKCFLNMYRTGTYRFIQNIAGWTARPEIKFLGDNIYPWDWRPKGINYKVNYNAKYDGFLKLENEGSDLTKMKTLFCIDDSGSTDFSNFYYDELEEIIGYYYEKNRGDIFYLWNETKKKITYEELEEKIKSKSGIGDTYPYLIAEIIEEEKNNKCRHLVIITDGCVSQNEIEEADKKIQNINYNFDYVTVYILGDDADLSIGAPFCRNTPNKTFSKRGPNDNFKEEITLSKEDIETLNDLEDYDNYEKFVNNYDKIFKAVQAKCIGTSDENLKEKLEIMFDNIIKSNKKIDFEFINSRKGILIGMTEGSIKHNFTLDKINAATYNFDNY